MAFRATIYRDQMTERPPLVFTFNDEPLQPTHTEHDGDKVTVYFQSNVPVHSDPTALQRQAMKQGYYVLIQGHGVTDDVHYYRVIARRFAK